MRTGAQNFRLAFQPKHNDSSFDSNVLLVVNKNRTVVSSIVMQFVAFSL